MPAVPVQVMPRAATADQRHHIIGLGRERPRVVRLRVGHPPCPEGGIALLRRTCPRGEHSREKDHSCMPELRWSPASSRHSAVHDSMTAIPTDSGRMFS